MVKSSSTTEKVFPSDKRLKNYLIQNLKIAERMDHSPNAVTRADIETEILINTEQH